MIEGEIDLRSANAVRHVEWSNGTGDGALFYAIEFFGEAGEALNVVKKLERERMGMVGSRATVNDLAEELADVVICIDLLLMAYQRPALVGTRLLPTQDAMRAAIALGRQAGFAMEWVLEIGDYEVTHPEWAYEELEAALLGALGFAQVLADAYRIDLRHAVVAKFNKTSAKYGLQTMMAGDASLY